MFDDLIPGNKGGAISFDDLIPQAKGRHLTFEEGQKLLEEEERAKRMASLPGKVGAFTSSAVEGLPVVGPYVLDKTQRAAAMLANALGNPDASAEDARAVTQQAQEENPYTSLAGTVTGAVGGSVPLAAALPSAFGAGAGGLLVRTIGSGLGGSGLAMADAAARGEDIGEAGLYGGAFGLAAPGAGYLIGKGGAALKDFIRNQRIAKAAGTTPYALSKINQAMTADAIDPATLRAQLDQLGPEGMIADLGGNLQRRLSGLANMPGEANRMVRTALDARQAGANARLATGLDDTIGRAAIPSQIDDALKAAQRQVGQQYDEVFKNARAVDTSKIAEGLESKAVNLRGDAQSAMQKVRSMLNITGADALDPNPGTLFQTRQAIDGMLETETNSKAIGALRDVRRQIDETLSSAVPGIKDVDAQFAELAKQRQALERGQTVLGEGRSVPRPSELADEATAGALPSGTLVGPSGVTARMRQGARAEIDRILGNNANDVAKLNQLIKSEGDWNRSRLATLFGQDKADRLFGVLDNELKFAQTRHIATGNSVTAGRGEEIRDLGGKVADGFGVRDAYAAGGLMGGARGAAMKLADKLIGGARQAGRQAKNASLAEAITGQRQALVDALIDANASKADPRQLDQLARALIYGSPTLLPR
jgi:hypothetical protein